ncbi:hypothetical protein KVV02_002492 [Mortierella alpina]|uniref:Uncharacterized protein n=1 Tax=Mortierella alpina TaxID=64518 RepID=A0A9P8CZL3_MORAP|nr:hypothetical protein KVV02_002492 [Mortierella alpina]
MPMPLATEERDPADHTQQQQQQQCQFSGSILQVHGPEQGDEGLPFEQGHSPIAQDRAPAVDLNRNVSPGTAEDTNAVPSEVSEAQAAIQDQPTFDADDRKGWKAIQRLTSMFLCRADLPPIAHSSQGVPPPPLSNVDGSSCHDNHDQDELCSTRTPTVYASSCGPHSRASMTAMAGEPPEDSSSTFTSSSSRIVFGRILLGLEEMLAMLSQLVRPDSRPRDATA